MKAKVNRKICSFPQLANYYIPIKLFVDKVLNMNSLEPLPITKKTIELGEKNSPDMVCSPFKYNLGNFIESLDRGANVLIQAGGGCRFGYYAELQEQILKDLGYDFEFIKLFDKGVTPLEIYKSCKRVNKKLNVFKSLYYTLLLVKMIYYMDELEDYVRIYTAYEKEKGIFSKIHNQYLEELKLVTRLSKLNKIQKKYMSLLKNSVDMSKDVLKIGIVGELYTLMEPNSNHHIEEFFMNNNVSVYRYVNITYLVFKGAQKPKKLLKHAGEYLRYSLGAGGTDSVVKSKMLMEKGFDGIIHMKSFGCTPEINAMPILQNLSTQYGIPILYFSFDTESSETGINTRLEAFLDMLQMRRNK